MINNTTEICTKYVYVQIYVRICMYKYMFVYVQIYMYVETNHTTVMFKECMYVAA